MSRRLVGAVVLLLALAGCGRDPKADPPPTPSPSTTPVSTTPSAPAMPDAAKENTKAGAIAFVRHYVEVLNYAQATGDVSALDSLEDPRCSSCDRVRSYLAGIYKAHGHVNGGAWTIKRIGASAGHDPDSWVVDVAGEFAPSSVSPSPGASPSSAAGGSAPTKFYVDHTDGWKVSQWTRGI